jgi:hypothetical protein
VLKINLKVVEGTDRGPFETLYRHFLGVTDENYENVQKNQTGLQA